MSIEISERKEHILDFLKQNSTAVLATANKYGEPHAATIYYTVDEDLNIYFITKRDTTKSQNLKNSGRGALAVHEATTQTTVQAVGKVEEETDVNKSQKVFSDILKISMETSESGTPPISKLQAGPYIAYRLTPDSARMASFIRPDSGSYERIFEDA